MIINNLNNFPVPAMGQLIGNAMVEVQTNTGFPLPLTGLSALGAVAAACQNMINVELPFGSITSTSLYMLSIAESGEGKTPTDRFFTQPIRDFEDSQMKKYEASVPKTKAQRAVWEIQRQEIEKAIKKNRKNALLNNDTEECDLLEKEFDTLQQALADHHSQKPKLWRRFKIFHGDTSPSKLLLDLYEKWPSGYFCSDEGGSVFRSAAIRDLGMLNKLWDDSLLVVDRMSSPSFQLKDARLSIFLAVQGGVLRDFLVGRGRNFRSIGALARYLVVCPISTKGTRILHDGPQFTEHLNAFHQRITDILVQDKLRVDDGIEERITLKLSPDARKYWYDFKNSIELELNPGRYLSDIDDFASKITTNLARIAALFHYFEGLEGDISLETVKRAGVLCEWFIHEFKRLFSTLPEISQDVADTYEMERFLWDWCSRHQGHPYILRSLVSQYGPNRLRGASGKGRRAYALDQLAMQGKIWLEFHGKKSWIRLNPQYFPVNVALVPYQSY
ncbi:YfjI family protein [Methylomonas koyamae]|uniref:YfjI family protein n=1 Tax=Methylomonas koyamae TaxID=702114 RepID=UPI000BC2EDFE|nr:YfjI family protein [Methylomonas koyamae]ATG88306.1 hypothetical protein MKLM6_0016 [Methylomonas koyamae]